MRNLTTKEKQFYENLTKYRARIYNGYYKYMPKNKTYGNKKYKRSRILMMLHLNKFLEPWEIVHHKDKNKLNDTIENLSIITSEMHAQYHSGDIGKKKNTPATNKTPIEIQKQIKKIASSMKKINYSKISRILKEQKINISSNTIAKYIKEK